MPQLTFFPGSVRERRPGQHQTPNWPDLADVMANAVTNDRRKGAAGYWVAARVNQARGRSDAACDPTDLVALDWDDPGPASPDVLSAALGSVWYVAHTTDTHEVVAENNPRGEPRWRVWVRLDRAYDAAELKRVVLPEAWAGAHLRAISQPAYVPTTGDDTWWLENPGGAPWTPRLSVPEAVAAPQPAPAGPRTNPSPASINALVTRWLSNPEGTNRLAGATGACLAEWGWADPDIEGFLAAWLHADAKLAKHTDDALRAAATRRAGGRIVGFPTMGELGVKPWEADGGAVGPSAAELLALADAPGPEGNPRFRFVSAHDIATADIPEPNWLCQGLCMAPGAPSLITGYGGSGKTTFVQHLAVCVAQGEPLLGQYPVRQASVVHIDHEQGLSLTMRLYQKLGLSPTADLKLASFPQWSMADASAEARQAFASVVATARGGLVIIDSFLASCQAFLEDGENTSSARAPLDFLTELSEASGATFLVIHHSRKDRSDPMTSARGSSAINDAVSLHIIYEKAEQSGRPTLSLGKVRNIRPAGALTDAIEVAIGPRGAPADGGFTLTSVDAEQATTDRVVALKDAIVGLLATGWAGSRNQLVTELKRKRNDVYQALAELTDEGVLKEGKALALNNSDSGQE